MADLLIFLLSGGCIGLAFIFLLIATFLRKSQSRRKFLYVLSFLALVMQSGCWHLATAIGNATGGHGNDDFGMDKYVFLAGAMLVVWAFILELIWIKSEAKKRHAANENIETDELP
jgi:predicted MFS family arabinose efflux permease